MRAALRARSGHATRAAAWLALALSLALTLAAWSLAQTREAQATRIAWQTRAGELSVRLSTRMLAYEQLLRGASGLFASTGTVTRADWTAFVGAVGLASLPGIEAMGWAPRVPGAEAGAHVDAIRRSGVPDYRLFPRTGQDLSGPVVYLEPMTARNARALGFDMYAEPVRRAAMQAARDTGRTSLTPQVVLVQEGEQPRQVGFLAYLPVYRSGASVVTVEQRRAALAGWVYAAFRAGDFVEAALGPAVVAGSGLLIELRDAARGEPLHVSDGLAASVGATPPAIRVDVPVVDRVWSLGAWPDPSAAGSMDRSIRGSSAVAIGGSIASLLIFAIAWTLASTRERAMRLADDMTLALREANESLEDRVRERTALLHDTDRRLATVTDKLRAVNAAFGTIGGAGPLEARLASVAAQLRTIVPSTIALAVASRAESAGGPAIGLDAEPALASDERQRWHRAALDAERIGDPPPSDAGSLGFRLQVPVLDAHGRARGYLLLGRASAAFAAEDTAVASQFALLVGTSLALHETIARERRARDEAERADRAKEEMLAVVSHELRTPLNAIQGWLHVLRRRRADDAAMLGRAIDVIQRNLDTQVQLVDDLLDTVRIVSGKLRLELVPLDLVPLLRAAVETVRPLAEGKRVALTVSIADDAFHTVGDASRLEQVVWNLLANAVKFTPAGGRIEVRLERLGWLAQLEVEDDGRGIDPSFLPHVFDRFRQADSSSTRAAGGLGLGLALVQHIVQAHGGQVIARSDGEGRGSVFTVSLPLGMAGLPGPDPTAGVDIADDGVDAPGAHRDSWDHDDATDRGDHRDGDDHDARTRTTAGVSSASGGTTVGDGGAPTAAPLAGLSILVVEDHDDSRELLVEFLSSRGASVLGAADATEAIARRPDLPETDAPTVLLCDIALPGEDGYALLARLRRDERARGVRDSVAFALSAFTRAEDRERSLAAGFREHLGKPVAPAELLARLTRLRDDDDVAAARPR